MVVVMLTLRRMRRSCECLLYLVVCAKGFVGLVLCGWLVGRLVVVCLVLGCLAWTFDGLNQESRTGNSLM